MTSPPDWAVAVPSTPSVHTLPSRKGGPLEPPMSWQQLQATVQFFMDSFLGQVAIAFGGIEIFGWKPFEFLVDWGNERIAQANRNYLAALNAQSSANYANTQLGSSFVSGLASDVTGGVALTYDFNGAADTDLGADFTRSSVGSGAGTFGPNGSGVGVWDKSGGNDRQHNDRHDTALATDTQIVMVVIANPPQSPLLGGNAYTWLRGRCSFLQDSEVYARIGHDDLQVGCWVANSETVFDNIAFDCQPGDVIKFFIGTNADDREFIVKRNDQIVYQDTDVLDVSQLGALYRYAGVSEKAANRASEFGLFLFSDQTVPAELDLWAAADRLPTSV